MLKDKEEDGNRFSGHHLPLVIYDRIQCLLDRAYELDHGISVGFWQVIELEGSLVCLAVLAVCMPHDGFYLVAGACIVQTVFGS